MLPTHTLPVLCSVITITKLFISEVLISWTCLEPEHAYVVVFYLSSTILADFHLHFPVVVQTQVWKAAVNKVRFSPLVFTDSPVCLTEPSGICLSPGRKALPLGKTGPVAFSPLWWPPKGPPLPWEQPFQVL